MERFHRLTHSLWDCKYHVVWIVKYRRKDLYRQKRKVVVRTIKKWAETKGIEILEGQITTFICVLQFCGSTGSRR